MAISKRIRFEIFKRDGFICKYCGKRPPEIMLEIDHILPISESGTDDMNNLLTSCFACNRGKSKILLETLPNSITENLTIIKEQRKQTKQYYKFLEEVEYQKEHDLMEIGHYFFNKWVKNKRSYGKYIFGGNWKASIMQFLKTLNKYEIKEAIDIAFSKLGNSYDGQNKTFRYMCGICWNKIKEKINPNYYKELEIRKCWNSQLKGSHYLDDKKIKEWLNKYSVEEIIIAMNDAKGYWNLLKEKLDGSN